MTGILRGFDQFMNIVLDQTVDDKMKQDIGMVVSQVQPLRALPAASARCTYSAAATCWDRPLRPFQLGGCL